MRPRALATAALAVAASLVVTTAAGAAGERGDRRASSPTVGKEVSPVDADGVLKPRYDIAHRYGGARCQRGSAMTGTAYRCHTSRSPQGVYDPCWVATSSDHVICLDVPWRRHEVTQLHVTS